MLDAKVNEVGSTAVSSYDYSVNSIGQRTGVTGASNHSYWYNQTGELVTADNADSTARNRAYAYDGIGNRLWESKAHAAVGGVPSGIPGGGQSTSYVSNTLNQYTAVGTSAPACDDDGNLTSYGGGTFTWNAENRLAQVDGGSGGSVSFVYDYLGRRARKTVAGGSDTIYLYDGWNLVCEYA